MLYKDSNYSDSIINDTKTTTVWWWSEYCGNSTPYNAFWVSIIKISLIFRTYYVYEYQNTHCNAVQL